MEPWDKFESGEFTEDERRQIRHQMNWLSEREPWLNRIVQVARNWWLFVAGVGTAFTGALGKAVEILSKTFGGFQP